jgi:hypothetical protein
MKAEGRRISRGTQVVGLNAGATYGLLILGNEEPASLINVTERRACGDL